MAESTVRMAEQCTCGAAIRLFGEPGGDDAEVIERLMAEWQAEHSGAGHVSCSPAEARYVRNGYAVPAWMRAGDGRD